MVPSSRNRSTSYERCRSLIIIHFSFLFSWQYIYIYIYTLEHIAVSRSSMSGGSWAPAMRFSFRRSSALRVVAYNWGHKGSSLLITRKQFAPPLASLRRSSEPRVVDAEELLGRPGYLFQSWRSCIWAWRALLSVWQSRIIYLCDLGIHPTVPSPLSELRLPCCLFVDAAVFIVGRPSCRSN